MAEQHDTHGHDSHGSHAKPEAGAWIAKHMGGAVMTFGDWAETFFEQTLFVSVNGLATKAGIAFLAIMTPVILVELVLRAL